MGWKMPWTVIREQREAILKLSIDGLEADKAVIAASEEAHRLRTASLLPGETSLRCPKCQTDRALARLVTLHDYVIRDGRVVELDTGFRVACQIASCGATFSIDRHGTFDQGVQALPLTPQLRAPGPDNVSGEKRPPPPPVWRTAKEAPAL